MSTCLQRSGHGVGRGSQGSGVQAQEDSSGGIEVQREPGVRPAEPGPASLPAELAKMQKPELVMSCYKFEQATSELLCSHRVTDNVQFRCIIVDKSLPGPG